ncbi:MAG: hypothetical protein ACRES2_03520 [Steroidobacteraceae bacterium]
MNVLLINHYAGSPWHGMEFRPDYLARERVRAGHGRVRNMAVFLTLLWRDSLGGWQE